MPQADELISVRALISAQSPGVGGLRAGDHRCSLLVLRSFHGQAQSRGGEVGLMAAEAKTHSSPPRRAGKRKTKSSSCSRSGARGHEHLCKQEILKTHRALPTGLMPHVDVPKHAHEARAEPVTQPNAVSTSAQPSFEAAPPEPGLANLPLLRGRSLYFFLLTAPRCFSPFDQPHLHNS